MKFYLNKRNNFKTYLLNYLFLRSLDWRDGCKMNKIHVDLDSWITIEPHRQQRVGFEISTDMQFRFLSQSQTNPSQMKKIRVFLIH